MSSDVAVLAEDLTKFYGNQRGIEGLDLDVRTGEVMGFLGPYGAGKTTMIRVLLDFLSPIRTVEIHFDDPVDPAEFAALPGVSNVMVSGPTPALHRRRSPRLPDQGGCPARGRRHAVGRTRPGGDLSVVLHPCWKEPPTLVRRSWRDDGRAVIGWAAGVGAFTAIYTASTPSSREPPS